jgi:apolipoprotein N-acyltransferase
MSALFGTLGLSFWVIFTNCLVAYAFLMRPKKRALAFALIASITPYLFGAWHLWYHSGAQKAHDLKQPPIAAAIVHSKKLPDEMMQGLSSTPLERAFESWQDVIYALAPYKGKKFDLILLPEVVVPFSSLSLIYPKDLMDAIFQDALDTPIQSNEEEYVCSEEIAKTLAFAFNSPVIIGLEGSHTSSRLNRPKFFNSAFCFTGPNLPHLRYDKQILVPMGEYIPFPWAKKLAEPYGIFDSFTPGTAAKLFYVGQHRIGPSICYEETFSNLMRQNKRLGATLFVNLTDDYWFPNSRLGLQHFEHARARTVENGVPLIRACNFGVSGAVDSLGRSTLAVEGTPYLSASIANVSSYHYDTIYGRWGDTPILLLSLSFSLFFLLNQTARLKKKE